VIADRRRRTIRGGLLAAGLAILSAGCATNPATGGTDLVTMSEREEVATGQQAHQQILQQYAVYDDAQLQTYVNNVGQAVAAHGHRPGLTYQFTVLDSPETNAFALPGGYVYITRGLLAYLNSEAELAGVLGHEVGHITARHAVRQQSTAQAANLGAGLLSILIPQLGQVGRQAVSLVGAALVRGYGREHELEADRLGAEYLARSGYDPGAMISLLRTLKAQETLDQQLAQLERRQARAYHGVFSTHPDNDTRLAEAIDTARQLTTASGEPGNQQFRDRFLDEIDGLIVGTNSAEGVVRENRFLHPDLDFALDFPHGWLIQNLPNRLLATEPGGLAQIQVSLVPVAAEATPEAVLAQLGVREFVGGTRFMVADSNAVTGHTRVNIQGVQRVARVSVILRRDQAFVITGITARAEDLAQFDASFVAVASQFRRLTEAEHVSIKPRRLQVANLNGPVTWAGLAKASKLKRLPEEQLRVLNAAPAAESAPRTKRIKIIE
jgi:predicted Zn-dependent protease